MKQRYRTKSIKYWNWQNWKTVYSLEWYWNGIFGLFSRWLDQGGAYDSIETVKRYLDGLGEPYELNGESFGA